MTKPVITKRTVKGAALTYNELDANFQNLKDATINFTNGTDTINIDLNDVVTLQGNETSNMKVTISEIGNTIIVDNVQGQYTKEPTGFENRTDSTITFNASTRTFTISGTYKIWLYGNMMIKTSTESLILPNTTGAYHIYFDSVGVLQYRTTHYIFNTDCPVAMVYWNAATGTAPYFSDERHGITMDWQTHEYLHRTRGASYAEGFGAANYTLTGTGSANADAQLDIENGIFYDEDIKVEITHSNTPTANTWQQDLQGPARIPVIYRSNGAWVRDSDRDYAFKNGTNLVTYNLNTAGVWTTPDCSSTFYVAYWIVATNNLTYPVLSIMGQRQDNKLSDSQLYNTWESLDLADFPSEEFRPLYRVIFRTASTYGNTPKAYLADIEDHRLTSILGTIIAGGTEAAAFQNVVVGATTITADSSTGTLTLVAGSNVTLTPNATTDTVTIAASGSGLNTNTIYVGDNISGDVAICADTNNDSISLIASVGNRIVIRDDATSTIQSSTKVELMTANLTLNNGSSPYYTIIDNSSNPYTYANNATVNFSNFSGMVMINRQDTTSGNVALWLCGGGVATKIGDSQANASGVIAGNGAVNGYTWTNNTGGNVTVTFAVIRGRTSG